MTSDRQRVLDDIADALCTAMTAHPLRVAIDGVTASGKTTFADELAAAMHARNRSSIRISMDGFHHPRTRRHRRGRLSAVGYYDDAYDFEALRELVLLPLGPGGSARYATAIIDLGSDQPLGLEPRTASSDAVVIVDGTFLQRPEIAELWDLIIFLQTPFDVALERGVARDWAELGGKQHARLLYQRRYHAACRRYLRAANAAERASILVDNSHPDAPRLIRMDERLSSRSREPPP